MRIQGGEYRSRTFQQPASRSVRPLSDKVRAAIFDVVGDISGSIVLDAYAGSGAAGFEALSRGAAQVEAIEANDRVAQTIRRNIESLGLHWGYNLHKMTVETWLALPGNQPDAAPGRTIQRYNLIIADPPYQQLDADVIERLARYLIPGGILALSHSSKLDSPVLHAAKLVKQKTYGDTALSFYTLS